jgi:4-amino-4-deoxy-L-arabinose transferase-like glycosyltransferase
MVEIITAILFFAVVYFAAERVPEAFYALCVAYFVRLGAAITNIYVFRLPDGDKDAIGFELTGWDLANLSWEAYLASFDYTSAYFSYGWLVALPYRLVGRVEFVPQMVNVLLGTLVVYFVYRAVRIAWTHQIAIHAAWVAALFPQLIHYSAVLLREAPIHFLVAVSVYYFVRYLYRGRRPLDAVWAVVFSVLPALLHGGMIVATVGLLLYFLWRGVRIVYWEPDFAVGELATIGLFLLVFTLLLVQGTVVQLEFSSVGSVQELINPQEFEEEATRAANVRLQGDASYPDFLRVTTGSGLALLLLPRVAYLLFSPFPWDISELAFHTLGFIDGLFYVLLAYAVYRRWPLLRRKKVVALSCILLPLALTFAIGTSNFGTAIRHRLKFFVVLLVLSGGFHNILGAPRLLLPSGWQVPQRSSSTKS